MSLSPMMTAKELTAYATSAPRKREVVTYLEERLAARGKLRMPSRNLLAKLRKELAGDKPKAKAKAPQAPKSEGLTDDDLAVLVAFCKQHA